MRAISLPIILLFFCHLSSNFKSISLKGFSWEMAQLRKPSPGQKRQRPWVDQDLSPEPINEV